MAGLAIKCPQCRKRMILRSTIDVTDTCRKAWAFCLDCEIKAIVFSELQQVQPATFSASTDEKE